MLKLENYTVYFLEAIDGVSGKIVYVGRVKFTNFNSRMSYHLSQGRQLAWCITGLIYAECRAIEQGDMMYYHTINRSDNLMNHIRGVSPTNSNKERYFMAIMDLINSGMYPEVTPLPASYWENLTENEWLNGGL